jgi:hypothetical protein
MPNRKCETCGIDAGPFKSTYRNGVFRTECGECIRTRQSAWRDRNAEKLRKQARARRRKDPEKFREQGRISQKRWREKNRSLYLARKREESLRYRAKKKGLTVEEYLKTRRKPPADRSEEGDE